jgi:hypothetical protein
MRRAVASAPRPSLPAAGLLLPVTKLVSMMMMITGTTNEATTVQIQLLGRLDGPFVGLLCVVRGVGRIAHEILGWR